MTLPSKNIWLKPQTKLNIIYLKFLLNILNSLINITFPNPLRITCNIFFVQNSGKYNFFSYNGYLTNIILHKFLQQYHSGCKLRFNVDQCIYFYRISDGYWILCLLKFPIESWQESIFIYIQSPTSNLCDTTSAYRKFIYRMASMYSYSEIAKKNRRPHKLIIY